MKKAASTIILIIGLFPTFVYACANTESDCGKPTAWHEGNNIELNINDDQSQNRSRWIMKLYSGNDIIIEKDEQYQGKSIKGTLGVIGGRMMITNGLKLKSGYEIDAADGPALMFQLMLRLLSEVAPGGPSKISAPIEINHNEKESGIKLATAAASAYFGAPWSVTGTLAPVKEPDFSYTLRFTSKVGEKNYTLILAGKWVKDISLGVLNGEKEIGDWQVYKIGPYTKKYEGGTIYDYGAQPISESFKNIAVLKHYIDQQEKHNKTK